MRFSSISQFTRARLVARLETSGGSAPAYPSTSNFTRRSMSLAEKEAWKNSTPNCFTRCAGTVIITPHPPFRVERVRIGRSTRYSNRRINPCQHLPFLRLQRVRYTLYDVVQPECVHD